jgi:hypothetical protein
MRETRTEKNYISKESFRRWVRAMHKQFVENSQAITTSINGTTYVYLRSKVGVARRNPNDNPDPQVGIAYAWARCTGQQEYYNLEDVYKPIAGDRVNVRFINDRNYFWTFVAEGVDNYCFRRGDGHLECYYKDRIKSITKAE